MVRRSRRIAQQRRINYNLANRFGIFGEASDSESDQSSLESLAHNHLDSDEEPVDNELEVLENAFEAVHLNLGQQPDQNEEMANVFETNPFSANINPATQTGLKLYQAATEEREDSELLSLKIADAKQFMDAMKSDAAKFGWNKLTSTIEVGGDKYDILKDFRHLSVEKVRVAMNWVYEDRDAPSPVVPVGDLVMYDIDPANENQDRPVFYARVRANIIGLRLLGSLNKSSRASLKLRENMYLWKTTEGEVFYDGPTMLQICIEKINPNTRVGVAHLKEQLRTMKLSSFGHNVRDMTDKMTAINEEIIQRGFTHDDFVLDIFQALLTGKNMVFQQYIQRKRDDWDIGTDVEPDDLITDAVTKYNNMIMRKTWKEVEPKDSKLAALTTELKDLREKFALVTKSSGGGSSSGGDAGKTKPPKVNTVEKWRLTKTLGDKVERDGRTWYWCHKQHNDGKGMYVTHHPDDHTAWLERKEKFKRERKNKKGDQSKDGSSNGKQDEKKTLSLRDNMKAAMVTKFRCSASDAEKLWAEVVKQSN